jgi:hypothetical protein
VSPVPDGGVLPPPHAAPTVSVITVAAVAIECPLISQPPYRVQKNDGNKQVIVAAGNDDRRQD